MEFRRYLQHIMHRGDIAAKVAPRGLDLVNGDESKVALMAARLAAATQ